MTETKSIETEEKSELEKKNKCVNKNGQGNSTAIKVTQLNQRKEIKSTSPKEGMVD